MQWNNLTPGQTEIKTGLLAALWSTSQPRRIWTITPAGPAGTNRYSQLEVLLRYGFNVLLK